MQVPKGKTIYYRGRKFKEGEFLPPFLADKFPEVEPEPDFEFIKTLEELGKESKPVEPKVKKKRKYTKRNKDYWKT